jgi:hypothetical protein
MGLGDADGWFMVGLYLWAEGHGFARAAGHSVGGIVDGKSRVLLWTARFSREFWKNGWRG